MSYHDAIPPAVTPFGNALDCGDAGYPQHDVNQAKALIAQYGKPVTIECLHSGSKRGREQGELLQQFAKTIGIEVNLVGLSFGPVIKKVITKDYQISTWRIPPAIDQGPVLFRSFHAVMYAGRIVEKAPVGELFAGMRMPYTRALTDSIPHLDTPPHTPLRSIGGQPPDLIRPMPGCLFSPRCGTARKRCLAAAPPFVSDTGNPDHWYACWFPLERSTA